MSLGCLLLIAADVITIRTPVVLGVERRDCVSILLYNVYCRSAERLENVCGLH